MRVSNMCQLGIRYIHYRCDFQRDSRLPTECGDGLTQSNVVSDYVFVGADDQVLRELTAPFLQEGVEPKKLVMIVCVLKSQQIRVSVMWWGLGIEQTEIKVNLRHKRHTESNCADGK